MSDLERRVKKVGVIHAAPLLLELQRAFWQPPEDVRGEKRQLFTELCREFPPHRLARELRGARLSEGFTRIYREVLGPHGWFEQNIGYYCHPEHAIILDAPAFSTEVLEGGASALLYACRSCERVLARQYFAPL